MVIALLDGTLANLEKIVKSMQILRMNEMRGNRNRCLISGDKSCRLMCANSRARSQLAVNNDRQSRRRAVQKFGDASVALPFTSKLLSARV